MICNPEFAETHLSMERMWQHSCGTVFPAIFLQTVVTSLWALAPTRHFYQRSRASGNPEGPCGVPGGPQISQKATVKNKALWEGLISNEALPESLIPPHGYSGLSGAILAILG